MGVVAVPFTNFSDKDYVGRWNGEDTLIPAHSMIFVSEQGIADVWAKALLDREIGNQFGKDVDVAIHPARAELLKKVFAGPVISGSSQTEVMNKMMDSAADASEAAAVVAEEVVAEEKEETTADKMAKVRAVKKSKEAEITDEITSKEPSPASV